MKKIDCEKLRLLVSENSNAELQENKIGCKEVVIHQNGECVYREVFTSDFFSKTVDGQGMIYRAASMTKPITSVAVLQLVDKGLLSPDDKIAKFFPKAKDLKVAEVENNKILSLVPLEREITVENLLSHTSGIGCEPITNIFGCTNNDLSLEDAIDDILLKPLAFQPDSSQCYSATEAFDVAAGIVEKASDCRFDEYLKEHIFKPLEMVNTTFCPTDEQWKNIVPMHGRTEDGKSKICDMPQGCVFDGFKPKRMPAGAGLVTTADDYIKFADMLCFGGITKENKRILSEKAVNLIASPHIPANIENWCEKWGLGVRIVVSNDYPYGLGIGCFGWSGAYGTHFWVDRENLITAVMMKNSQFDGGAGNKSACQLEKDVYDSLR